MNEHIVKREHITHDEQLRRWVEGDSVHMTDTDLNGGECCPDFSCCKPALLAEKSIRQAFAAADQKGCMKFLGIFLGALIAHVYPSEKIAVVTDQEEQ